MSGAVGEVLVVLVEGGVGVLVLVVRVITAAIVVIEVETVLVCRYRIPVGNGSSSDEQVDVFQKHFCCHELQL